MLKINHNLFLNMNKDIMLLDVFVHWNLKKEFTNLNLLITIKMKFINFFFKLCKNFFSGKENMIKKLTIDLIY
jgi:hypothetical protein